MMKILIVDDHALVRRGLHYVVKEGFPEAEVTEAESAAAALEHIHNGKEIDLALVDVRMPDLDGLELLRALKADRPDMPVVMLSTYDNAPYVKRALADGASGYLLKDATPEDLSQAINVALSGSGNVLSPRVIQNLFEEHESAGRDQNGRRGEFNLTQREHDILELLAEGQANREIAGRLYLSEKTVKAHLAAIFRKLGVTNRTQAAMMAVQMGVGPIPGALVHEWPDRRPSGAEVFEEPTRRGPSLALVLAARAPVRGLGLRGQAEERDLSDLHPRVEGDRQVRDVRELERQVAVPPRVHVPGRRVDQQAEPAERGLPLQARHEVVREGHALEGRSQDELARMQDERLVGLGLDQFRQIGLLLLHVDVGVAVVREHPELGIDVQVHRRGLHAHRVERIDHDATGVDLLLDRAVGQDHRADATRR